jgi:predicted enzyme related to lactoylglutathione lyase
MRSKPSLRSDVRYVHTNLVSRDWRQLARFYIRVFGCTIEPPERDLKGAWLDRLTSIRNVHVRGAHLRLPGHGRNGPTLEIFQYAKAAGSKPTRVDVPGIRHLAFSARNVEEVLARVESNGGSRVGELVSGRVEGVGSLDVVYARDPEGNIIEIQKWGAASR